MNMACKEPIMFLKHKYCEALFRKSNCRFIKHWFRLGGCFDLRTENEYLAIQVKTTFKLRFNFLS